MKESRRVAIFGGTFDPVHFGHLNAARDILEKHGLDEVWFCPASVSPHKREGEPGPGHHRLKMLQLAIEGMPCFRAIDLELKRPGPSYTIDTLRELISNEELSPSPRVFSLIIGEDSAQGFFRWRLPEEIVKLAPVYVARRSLQPIKFEGDPQIRAVLERGMTQTRILEISATEIRERVGQKKYIQYLTPPKVVDYIYENHLYLQNS